MSRSIKDHSRLRNEATLEIGLFDGTYPFASDVVEDCLDE